MTANSANASAAASATSSADILSELDRLLDATPADNYVCKPQRRSTVAGAAEEIRRLRVQVGLLRRQLDEVQP